MRAYAYRRNRCRRPWGKKFAAVCPQAFCLRRSIVESQRQDPTHCCRSIRQRFNGRYPSGAVVRHDCSGPAVSAEAAVRFI